MGVRRLIGFALVFCVLGAFAKPVDLLGCFADAAENDPTYQSQVAIYLAQKQAIPEAVSAVLPQVTLSAAIAREYEEQGLKNPLILNAQKKLRPDWLLSQ